MQTAAASMAASAAPWAQAQGIAPPPATLQIVGPWEFTSLSPASSGFMLLNLQVCETLLGASDNGRPQPALAQRWQVSADGLVWQFTLRPQARFHNGDWVTAQAVVQ
ncbi:MAG: ABC transporter substrate-binding protein, partial [Burkholderiaceae bacterium]|nr:ABC transporter substrate-binding protein [Burkholderiaceae bacterium]